MHSNLVIKQQKTKPWYVGVGLVVVLIFTATFLFGRFIAISDLAQTKEKLALAEGQLLETRGSLENLNERLVMQKQSSEVDDLSNQELISSVKRLQLTNKQLQEELTFYRRIMAPELDKQGLVIDSLKVVKSELANHFLIRTTLIQAGKQNQFLKGTVSITVKGTQNGQPKELDIRELGTFNAKHFQFQFRYFLNIEGLIELPSDFIANSVDINAQTKGLRKNQRVNKQIPWQPVESQNHVR